MKIIGLPFFRRAATRARANHAHSSNSRFGALVLGCIGVVYGDIGTSPLYALRESVKAAGDGAPTPEAVLGVLSLLLWSLILVVTVKYVLFILRADNQGEGGVLSLMALVRGPAGRPAGVVLALGMIGAALFYGDALLTPAISVLSAVEGLTLATPVFQPYVVPLALVILGLLFSAQRGGTGKVAALFGPVTLVWFAVMAAMAVPHLVRHPEVFHALFPQHGVMFLLRHPGISLAVLGAVFLSVTGAEALYADMGHFGRAPIRLAWMSAVFPALALNYLGQGAMILHDPAALENPFFLMAPSWALLPLVGLATAATVIASQAVITGAYSITRQAIQLGMLPRMEILHTSDTEAGQIYMRQVNTLLLIGVAVLVLAFKTSGDLASAYGIAVSGTMLVTTLLAFLLLRRNRQWPLWLCLAAVLPPLAMDATFLSANAMKLLDGGYVPLGLGCALVLTMWVWRRGTAYLALLAHRSSVPLTDLAAMLGRSALPRVQGTAVFLTSEPDIAPTSLMHNLKHNKVLHRLNIILTVRVESSPHVEEGQRAVIERLGEGLCRVTLRFGYMETPDVPAALVRHAGRELGLDIMSTSFFLGRRILKASPTRGLPLWQDRIFILLARNATNATEFYRIPAGRVVELGTQVVI
jgi:KUP system potassium uptake protein